MEMPRTSWYWPRLLAINVLVGVILLAFVLLCVEAYLRTTIPTSSRDSVYAPTLTTRRYKVMKPDTRIIAWGSEFRTNRLGFRDRKSDVPPKRPSGFRVIVLGDSFTASAGVDFDRIYTSLLEKDIRRRVPDAEVMNLAVGGYNIVQYDLVLKEVGLSLGPDLVVVGVFPFNDLSNDDYRANFEDASGRGKRSKSPWYQDLYVYRAFLGKVVGRLSDLLRAPEPRPASTSQNGPAKTDTASQDSEENLSALRSIVELAHARGIDVVVALLPNTDTFESQRRDFAPFEKLCNEQRWSCVSLLERFLASGASPRALRLNLLDPHPNERYNALVAQYVGQSLMPYVTAWEERRGFSAR